MESYRDLVVWQKGIDLVEEIYRLTRNFPSDERYGMTSQIRRASVSIPANLAEGYSRKHRKEFFHFVCIAFASGAELETHLIIAKRLEFIPAKQYAHTDELLNEVMKMLNGLRKSLEEK